MWRFTVLPSPLRRLKRNLSSSDQQSPSSDLHYQFHYRLRLFFPVAEFGINTGRNAITFTVHMVRSSHQVRHTESSTSTQRSTRDGMPLVKQCLMTCQTSHGLCNQLLSARPSRLVFIGDNTPRLTLASQQKDCPSYATLSHCWGSEAFVTLNTRNFDAFQVEIPE
ncbi:hypothetical protein L207DRAFT_511789 [Hyaloscypha variabilis F]|uniref:Uncharacterized protein n=1 Tax=Hyaloscypha variabilis (strain UAMH 11265 / GT02V1 / F) TaxID=1149755 RepID=A0A2J6RP25_HYAVF|nr:hypothetical protein L207DRAFT_511789 [Hyaloscypha variabilis F]